MLQRHVQCSIYAILLIVITHVTVLYMLSQRWQARPGPTVQIQKNKKNRKIVKQLARVVIHDCNEYAKIAIFGYLKTQLNIDEK